MNTEVQGRQNDPVINKAPMSVSYMLVLVGVELMQSCAGWEEIISQSVIAVGLFG